MFSRTNLLRLLLISLFIGLFVLPFNFSLKTEFLVFLFVFLILLVIIIILSPTTQKRSIDRVVEFEIESLKTKEQLDNLVLSIPVPLVIVDQNLKIVLSNLAFKQLFSSLNDSFKEADHSLKSFINHALLSSGSTRQNVFVLDREYLMISNHLQFDDKEATLLLFNDITSFMETQKAQKRFIADASHELKTPITAIKGMNEILLTRPVEEETRLEFLEQIQKETNRLQNIVHDLLEVSKHSNNRIILNYSSFNFSDLVKEIYHSLKPLFIQKEITFIYDFKPLFVYLDYEKMGQVLSNLFSNALDFSDQGTIQLRSIIENEQLIIEIQDNGVGIEEKHLPYLFDRFYRVDSSRARQIGGSGLGLSIVKQIVEAHKGTIEVKSELQKGTTFKISISLIN